MLERVKWDTSCRDWRERILRRKSLVPALPLFDEEVERALRVFKRLRIPDVVGTPTNGEACLEWVFDLVRAVFGSYDPAARRRMIREFFLLIPKKNGKSSLAAAIMVTAAIVNRRPAAELLLIAPTKKIADIAYKQAAGIIKLDPELMKLFHMQQHQRTITNRVTDAAIMIKAADADVITGSKATYILVDETHEFAKKPAAASVFVEIRGGLASRPDGFMLQITTQSKEPPAGVFKAELENARAVRDGLLELPLLPILYELPLDVAKDGGWKNPATWSLVNPNLHKSVDEAFLADELVKAEREGPEQLHLLASQHFNVQVGAAENYDGWRGATYWQACADKSLTLPALIERSEVATIGFDVGGLDDLFGLAVIGRERVTRRWLLWTRAYCVRLVLERRKEIASRLLDFEKEGSLVIRDRPGEIIPLIIADIAMVKDAGLLPEKDAIGFDPNSVAAMIEALAGIGVTGEMLRRLIQGPALSPAIWGIEHKLSDGTLTHCGSDLMNWVVGNAKVEMKANGNMITKQVAGRAKIDPLHAAFCAAIPMSWNPEPKKSPTYQMLVFG